MKILMINKYLYPKGGSEVYMLRLGEYLSSLGHSVEYFGMSHKDNIVGNSCGVYTSEMDFHGGSQVKKISYPLKTVYSAEARKKLRKLLSAFSPDVIHINNFNYQLTPSVILEATKYKKESGCRIIHTAHDLQLVCPNHMCKNPITDNICEKCVSGQYFNCVKGKCIHGSGIRSILGAAESAVWHASGVYKNFDAVICCSEFLKSKLNTLPELKGKTVALHNFVTAENHKAHYDKKDYILYFGRYSKEKGIRTLLKVCRELPDIKFVFAGNGSLEKEINAVPNVRNAGFKQGSELEQLIGEALFSVYPSEWYENCPFSVIESQTYGTPVLGANIGGIPEIISDKVTGELFESGSAENLKEKITRLYSDRPLLSEYSSNCRKKKFAGIEQYTEKLMKIYRGNSG
ncbi:MAG: glycosyltransferase family 4 protein [Ruminococcus sp.]|nr:glycosyltransferase family 4 protein [Ruminococcus sp.]